MFHDAITYEHVLAQVEQTTDIDIKIELLTKLFEMKKTDPAELYLVVTTVDGVLSVPL